MTKRLASIDALRGFDMLWIIGGTGLVGALAEATNWRLFRWMESQSEHVEWNGFTLYDLIFPLFLFLAGVSMPFSIAQRLARGDTRRALLLHAVRRALLLVLLGCLYNGLLRLDLENQRYASVLGRIGLAWLGAALITLHTSVRGQVLWLVGILLGYWAVLTLVPVPGAGAGDLSPGRTLADYLDRQFLPGRLHRGDRDPEGLLSTVPAVGTALLGVLAGHLLRRDLAERAKLLRLVLWGLFCLGAGGLWSLVFPLNKNLWTSSFVLWCGGASLLLLALFHAVVDVLGRERWATFLIVIGTNAITVYLLEAFVDWWALVTLVLNENALHPAILWAAVIGAQWSLLYVLHRKRIFLRV